MASDLSERIIETAGKVARERFAPGAIEADLKHIFPRENIRILGEADFLRIGVSEDKGGIGLGRKCFSSVTKEIAKACASTALVYVSHSVAVRAVELGGGDEVQKEWLPKMLDGTSLGAFAVHEPGCGSNSGLITTYARKEGDVYIINGTKFFITSAGEADVYAVLVKMDLDSGSKGMSLLLVNKDAPGLSFGKPEDKMGLTSTSSREIFFNDCYIPASNLLGNEGEGGQLLGEALIGWGFFGAAAISAGIANAAVEQSVKHTRERTIGGQPIAVHQSVQSMITEMVLKSEAIEALLEKSIAQADEAPEKTSLNAFKSKLFASETAIDVANLALQAMGGHGYCRDYSVERLFRDARGLTLHFKTSEWLRQDIAKIVTGI